MYWFLGGEFGSSFFDYTRIASTFRFWNLLIQNFQHMRQVKKKEILLVGVAEI